MAIRDHMGQGYGAKTRVKIMTVDTVNRRIEGGLKDGSMAQIAVWDDAGHIFRWPKEGEIWIIRRDSGVWRLDSRVQSGQINAGGASAQPEPAPITNLKPGEMRLDATAIYDANGSPLGGTTGWVSSDIAGNGAMRNVTGIAFSVGASEVWSFEIWLYVSDSDGALSPRYQLTGPASPQSVLIGYAMAAPTGFPTTGGSVPKVATAFSSATSMPDSGTINFLVIRGTIVNGTQAEAVQLQFNGTSAITVKTGSWSRAWKQS